MFQWRFSLLRWDRPCLVCWHTLSFLCLCCLWPWCSPAGRTTSAKLHTVMWTLTRCDAWFLKFKLVTDYSLFCLRRNMKVYFFPYLMCGVIKLTYTLFVLIGCGSRSSVSSGRSEATTAAGNESKGAFRVRVEGSAANRICRSQDIPRSGKHPKPFLVLIVAYVTSVHVNRKRFWLDLHTIIWAGLFLLEVYSQTCS